MPVLAVLVMPVPEVLRMPVPEVLRMTVLAGLAMPDLVAVAFIAPQYVDEEVMKKGGRDVAFFCGFHSSRHRRGRSGAAGRTIVAFGAARLFRWIVVGGI